MVNKLSRWENPPAEKNFEALDVKKCRKGKGKLEFIALKDLYVIASQCAHWRGNPHPLTHQNEETAKKENGLPHQ